MPYTLQAELSFRTRTSLYFCTIFIVFAQVKHESGVDFPNAIQVQNEQRAEP